jgi:hypothetical protein
MRSLAVRGIVAVVLWLSVAAPPADAVAMTTPPPAGGTHAAGAPARVLRSPQRVTLADSGATVELPVGRTFLLYLGGPPPEWRVEVANPRIVSRVVNIMVIRGGQGVYKALTPGRTRLTAIGSWPCRQAQPPCMVPDRSFQITVVVRRSPRPALPGPAGGD